MDEEYPDQGTEDKDQNISTERSGSPASPEGHLRPSADALPPTGDERVDAALAGLSRLRGAPAEEHVAVLEEAYGRLRDVLGELDAEPDPDQRRP